MKQTPTTVDAKLMLASSVPYALRLNSELFRTAMQFSVAANWNVFCDLATAICTNFRALTDIIGSLTRQQIGARARDDADDPALQDSQEARSVLRARSVRYRAAWAPLKAKLMLHATVGLEPAPEDTSWTIEEEQVDQLAAAKRPSALGPDGIACGAFRAAGGIENDLLFLVCRQNTVG